MLSYSGGPAAAMGRVAARQEPGGGAGARGGGSVVFYEKVKN